jgi:hypothetical protein
MPFDLGRVWISTPTFQRRALAVPLPHDREIAAHLNRPLQKFLGSFENRGDDIERICCFGFQTFKT